MDNKLHPAFLIIKVVSYFLAFVVKIARLHYQIYALTLSKLTYIATYS